MARFTLAFITLCCLAALVAAASHDNEHRGRRGGVTHYRRHPVSHHGPYAARSRHAPKYSAPLTQEEQPEEEEPVQDEEATQEPQDVPQEQEQEEEQVEEDEPVEEEEEEATPAPVKVHKPAHRGRGRPQRPSADQAPNNGGATAIATAYSKGNNAQANSHAAAYGGSFKGGNFGQRQH